jgi:hypothetical protein
MKELEGLAKRSQDCPLCANMAGGMPLTGTLIVLQERDNFF